MPEPEVSPLICPQCATEVPDRTPRCPRCGFPFERSAKPGGFPPPSGADPLKKWTRQQVAGAMFMTVTPPLLYIHFVILKGDGPLGVVAAVSGLLGTASYASGRIAAWRHRH